ncbi:MAG TPA: hypothetical protein PLI48_06080 [Gammaproteobacteria bacterium]|nr:hypothetical protein [Gammaproteobacteria bacterium]
MTPAQAAIASSSQGAAASRARGDRLPRDLVPLVIGVTGHRDLLPGELPELRRRTREFLADLQAQHPDLPLAVMSPLAEGADRMVAEEARALGIPLIVPTPLPMALYEQDFRTPGSLQQFRELCAEAEVVELPLLPGDTPESVAGQGPRRDAHYARLGIYLCAHCHVLMAVWDGKPSEKLGGTAQVVRFHHWDEMPGFVERKDSSVQILAKDESDLVYHLVCSRDRPDGRPAAGLEPFECWWYTTDEAVPRSKAMPAEYHAIFARAAEFNRHVRQHRARIRAGGWPLLPADAPPAVAEAAAPVNTMFMAADWLAIHFQSRVTMTLRALYVLAALMGLAFIAYADLPGFDLMVYFFLGFFAAGVLIYRFAERGGWHRKYLDYRALAEGLRVQCYWIAAGVTAGRTTKFAHDNFLQKQDVELGWIRNVMRYTGRLGDIGAPTRAGLDFARREWVGEPHPGGGQLAYYERKALERTRLSRSTAAIGSFCLWAGITVAILLALFGRLMPATGQDLFIVLMGVLPLVAAVREAYAQKRAEKELIKQYVFMARIFRNARRQLEIAGSDGMRRQILKALGDAALEEHAQWLLMHRERPLEHGRMS